MDERVWSIMGKRLGYTEQELEAFRANPRNEAILSRAAELTATQFVAEVIEAHGCNSRHRAGQKIYLDGYGNLLRHLNPDKMCIYLVAQLQPLVFAAQELIYAGVDPGQLKFDTAGCLDVGHRCGGWGKVTVRLSSTKV